MKRTLLPVVLLRPALAMTDHKFVVAREPIKPGIVRLENRSRHWIGWIAMKFGPPP